MDAKPITRRDLLKTTAEIAAGTLFVHLFPASITDALAQQQTGRGAAPPADPVAAMRAQMAAAPIEAVKLADNATMLSGPGGNVAVLNGPDGKIVVDGFVQPAWPTKTRGSG